jgi:hypothetical protein
VNPMLIDQCPPRLRDGSIDVRRYIRLLDAAYNHGLAPPRDRSAQGRERVQRDRRRGRHVERVDALADLDAHAVVGERERSG